MFALGIIDKLKPEDLTGGKIIAGTGTIDDEGNVGPIGGIPQKLVGAKDAGAKIFLTPADNCAEAVRNAVPGLPMAEVATLDDALTALQTFTQRRYAEAVLSLVTTVRAATDRPVTPARRVCGAYVGHA